MLGTRLVGSGFYILLANAASALFGFLFWMLAARFYSTADVGLASAVLAAAGLVGALTANGLRIGVLRLLPEEKDKEAAGNTALTIGAALALVGGGAFLGGLPWWSPELRFLLDSPVAIISFLALSMLLGLLTLQGGVLLGARAPKAFAVQQTLSTLLRLPLAGGLVSAGVLGMIHSWTIASCLAFAAGSWMMARSLPGYRPRLQVVREVVKRAGRFSAANYLADVISILPTYVLPLMVVGVLSAESNAYYRIAFAMATLLFGVSYATSSALLVEGSFEPEKRRVMVRQTAFVVLGIMATGIVFFVLAGRPLLSLFGSAYAENGFQLLLYLALAGIPLTINELYIQVKRLELKTMPMVVFYCCTTGITIIASALLMNTFGLLGVAFGWIAGQLLPALYAGAVVVRYIMKDRPVGSG